MYVAVKGGEQAIDASLDQLARERRGDTDVPELSVAQVRQQMSLAVDRVMCEGSLYDPDLAALAIKQARGDLFEAVFLLRAYRTTLPRFGVTAPLDTGAMTVRRRISATFKDIPGGQILGPSFDYSHRLLDFALMDESAAPAAERTDATPSEPEPLPRVTDILGQEGLIEDDGTANEEAPGDLTREPLRFPASRDIRLQNLARGDEGFLLSMAYSTQRGYGRNHPFAGEIRMGDIAVVIEPEELGFAIEIGDVTVTECQMITQFKGSLAKPPQFTRGYGLTFGYCERKAMAMALVDRSLRAKELGEDITAPAQDEEFVLAHSDSVEASGFVQHLKLPHYIDFQSELLSVRDMRAKAFARQDAKEADDAA
jgi:alpha-D-ribose 1-methylphosphonate 5-triphosphate synthase subunit PhnI